MGRQAFNAEIACDAAEVFVGSSGMQAPAIYVVDMPEHPFDLAHIAQSRASTIVRVPIPDWNDNLTPWPAPGLYRGEPAFGGHAPETLRALLDDAIPAIERAKGISPTRRAICGYSLGGLFALYAFTHAEPFAACACLSGSVWYEGWVEHLRGLSFDGTGRFAFLSVGTKEKRAALAILRQVQDNMGACADILRARGCETEFAVGPGNHMSFVDERFDAGIGALDRFLAEPSYPM